MRVLGIALIVFPLAATPRQINQAGYLILVTVAFLSLVVADRLGRAGSLGQFAFVAVAAVVGGALTARVGISFWFVLVIVPFFTAAFDALWGSRPCASAGCSSPWRPSRSPSPSKSALFEERYFDWLLAGAVERPTLFFLDFEDSRSMYYFNLLVLAFAVFVVVVLRRSRPGRVLIALRENENNLRSFGINPTRMRLAAFAISGFLCGLAGVMLAHHNRAVTAADFPAQQSLDMFLYGGGRWRRFGPRRRCSAPCITRCRRLDHEPALAARDRPGRRPARPVHRARRTRFDS